MHLLKYQSLFTEVSREKILLFHPPLSTSNSTPPAIVNCDLHSCELEYTQTKVDLKNREIHLYFAREPARKSLVVPRRIAEIVKFQRPRESARILLLQLDEPEPLEDPATR